MAVRFKLDENIPRDAGALMRDAGYDVDTVLDEGLGGGPDPGLFEICQAEGRVLVTLDLDFADIRQYPPARHVGVWALRPSSQSIENILELLRGALTVLRRGERIEGRLWIVERERVRSRE